MIVAGDKQEMNASSTVDAVTASASALADSANALARRAQDFATQTALPAVNAAASQVQQTANETVLPALQSAAGTVADSARGHSRDLWSRVAETEQAQELARRAGLVAAGTKGESPRRWPLLVAGVATGVLLGGVLGRRTASPANSVASEDPKDTAMAGAGTLSATLNPVTMGAEPTPGPAATADSPGDAAATGEAPV